MNIDEYIQQPGQREQLLKGVVADGIHVALPGIIVQYDTNTRTAMIQPVIRKWNSKENPPLLMDVPVFFPGYLTFPVEPGDECLVVFADVCIDAWFENGGVSVPISARKHDLSDGFAFVGFSSRRNANKGMDLVAKLEELEARIKALEEAADASTTD